MTLCEVRRTRTVKRTSELYGSDLLTYAATSILILLPYHAVSSRRRRARAKHPLATAHSVGAALALYDPLPTPAPTPIAHLHTQPRRTCDAAPTGSGQRAARGTATRLLVLLAGLRAAGGACALHTSHHFAEECSEARGPSFPRERNEKKTLAYDRLLLLGCTHQSPNASRSPRSVSVYVRGGGPTVQLVPLRASCQSIT